MNYNLYNLYIFDVDGTLAERDSDKLLPGVAEWFAANGGKNAAIATNQGGVGLRHWMEEGGFGDPSQYPTEPQVALRMRRLRKALGISASSVFVSYAYQAQSGLWNPPPQLADESWSHEWRKPSPGMLLAAMQRHRTSNALMIGDRQEDKGAALAAGIDFMWAVSFFAR